MAVSIASFVAASLAAPPAHAQSVVKYDPTDRDFKYVYATTPPVATLKPGDTLETRTIDAFGGVIRKPGDTMAMVKGDNPLTGPFAIAGAEPGDTLVVKIPRAHRGPPRGRRRAGARVRRAQIHHLYADAEREPAGKGLVL
jgi:hypothetical protein